MEPLMIQLFPEGQRSRKNYVVSLIAAQKCLCCQWIYLPPFILALRHQCFLLHASRLPGPLQSATQKKAILCFFRISIFRIWNDVAAAQMLFIFFTCSLLHPLNYYIAFIVFGERFWKNMYKMAFCYRRIKTHDATVGGISLWTALDWR